MFDFFNSFQKIFIRMADNGTKSAPLMAAGRIDRRLKIVKIYFLYIITFPRKSQIKNEIQKNFSIGTFKTFANPANSISVTVRLPSSILEIEPRQT